MYIYLVYNGKWLQWVYCAVTGEASAMELVFLVYNILCNFVFRLKLY